MKPKPPKLVTPPDWLHDPTLDDPRLDTFDGWSRRGYRIYKGAKACARRHDGTPLFHFSSTWTPSYDDYCDRHDSGDFDGGSEYWQDACDAEFY